MPTDNDKDDPNKQGTGRLKDGLDAAGKLRPGAHIWRDRDYLPHVESTDLVQHVCFRLEDSLPRQVVQQMEAELMSLPPSLRSPEQEKRVNAYLDAGHGSCILRDPFIAELIDSTLLHFHGDRYTLYAWCIMPNHVHVLFQPEAGWTMSKIVASWKSFTGRRISAHRKELLASTAGGGARRAPRPLRAPPGSAPPHRRVVRVDLAQPQRELGLVEILRLIGEDLGVANCGGNVLE